MSSVPYDFGPFRLLGRQRLLMKGSDAVRLGSRATDILLHLVERAGEVVGKAELLQAAWPGVTVVEANLTVNIAALRRALDDGADGGRYIVNVPGRGYSFVAPIRVANEEEVREAEPVREPRDNLPAGPARLIGRDEAVRDLTHRLAHDRLIAIVGAAGIGKTSLALKVADIVKDHHPDGVWMIDLTPLTEGRLIAGATASAMRLELRTGDPAAALAHALRSLDAMLVLDNCEHLIDDVADTVVTILKAAPRIRILATSREPLRIEGEQIFRVEPLESPEPGEVVTAAQAMGYSAVQMFVERACTAKPDFGFTDAQSPAVIEICRRLDGIPLAIEIASARVGVFGVQGIAAQIAQGVNFFSADTRSAASRHRAISTALDWSYGLLSPMEQAVFRRAGVFVGGFTFAAAAAVCSNLHLAGDEATEHILELVSKSMIAVDASGPEPRLRLLETTRAYALNKLRAEGELDATQERHAVFFRDILVRAAMLRTAGAQDGWPDSYVPEIDNVRAALAWALDTPGQEAITAPLAAASGPLWLALSHWAECRSWMTRAIEVLGLTEVDAVDSYEGLNIQLAHGASVVFTEGLKPETIGLWRRIYELAERLGDTTSKMMMLHAIWTCHIRRPDLAEAPVVATQYEALARISRVPGEAALAQWVWGTTAHHRGEQAKADAHFEAFFTEDAGSARFAFLGRTGFDCLSSSRSLHAMTLWLRGSPAKALDTAHQAIDEARQIGRALPICDALIWSGFTLVLSGIDLNAAEACGNELAALAEDHGFNSHHALGLALRGLCRSRRDDHAAAARLLEEAMEGVVRAQYGPLNPLIAAELAGALRGLGRLEEAQAVLIALEAQDIGIDGWCLPEFLHAKGRLARARDDAAGAERWLSDGLDLSERQGASAWSLRAATALAELWITQGRSDAARNLLGPIHARFIDGLATPDLKAASAVLRMLS